MLNDSSRLNDSSSNNDDFRYWYVVAAINTLSSVIGTLANCLTLVIIRRNTAMHTAVNFLLANLAVSDILAILWPVVFPTMELFIDFGRSGTVATTIYCTFVEILLEVVLSSSFITVAILSVQHYHCLVCPMTTALRIEVKNTKYVIIVVWMLSFLLAVPTMVNPTTDRSMALGEHDVCHSQMSSVSDILFITVLFLLLLVIVVCNSRILHGICISKTILGENVHPNGEDHVKQKLVKTRVLITVLSIVCYLPMAVELIIAVSSEPHYLLDEPLLIVNCVLFDIKGTLNPFLYAFQSSNHRAALRKLLCKCRCKNPCLKHVSSEIELNCIDNV